MFYVVLLCPKYLTIDNVNDFCICQFFDILFLLLFNSNCSDTFNCTNISFIFCIFNCTVSCPSLTLKSFAICLTEILWPTGRLLICSKIWLCLVAKWFHHTFFSLNSSCVVLLVYYIFKTVTLSLCIPVLFFYNKMSLAFHHSFYYNNVMLLSSHSIVRTLDYLYN